MNKKYTKTQLISKCRTILYKSEIDDDDELFLRNILFLHPDHIQKIGCGIKRFFTAKTPYGNLCFFILRTDGSKTDFSFPKCIMSSNINTTVNNACRNAIHESIKQLKEQSENVIHHHYITFVELVELWKTNNPDIDLTIQPSKDNNMETQFQSKETIKSFEKFHHCFAHLIEINKNDHQYIHSNNLILDDLESYNIKYKNFQ